MTDFEKPRPAIELEQLETIAGVWFSEDTHNPMPWMPEGGTGRSRFDFRVALGGYCFLADFMGKTPMGEMVGHEIWYFDHETKKFKIQHYDNFGYHLEGCGNFVNQKTLEIDYKQTINGKEYDVRHIFRIVNEEAMIQDIECKIDGEYKLSSQMRYRRIK